MNASGPGNGNEVIVVGDLKPDVTFHLPRFDEKVDAARHGPLVSGGGTGANTAFALARLGCKVAFIGAVGDDPLGHLVVEELKGAGVDTRGCLVLPDQITPMVFALVQPDGERALYRWPTDRGADWLLREQDLDLPRIRAAAWLHTTGICLRRAPARESILAAMRVAHQAGVPVSFDLNFRSEQATSDAALRRAFLKAVQYSDVVFGHGDEEIRPLAGRATVAEAASELGAGQRLVVARHGADGVQLFAGSAPTRIPAYVIQPVNTVGAGDMFDAGFIAARLDGLDPVESTRRAHAVAALKIVTGGARAAPTRAEVAAFMGRQKVP